VNFTSALKKGLFSGFPKPLVDKHAEDQLLEAAIN
jgi:hypothetical protein